MDTLDMPSFLRRPRGPRSAQFKLTNITRRWSRGKIVRPAGETWASAVLREVCLLDEAQPIGCGRRLVWVREGRKWCRLCSLDGTKTKVTMSVWATIARRTA